MTAPSRHPLQLERSLVAFLREPVAINLASHDATLLPSIARGYGCRVSADRRTITVFVARQAAAAVLRDLAAGAPIAAAFCRPKTHQTFQFKGSRAEIVAVGEPERALMRAYAAAFYDEIFALGYHEAFTRALVAPAEDDALGVVFTPSAVFDQTPGPAAGRALEPDR